MAKRSISTAGRESKGLVLEPGRALMREVLAGLRKHLDTTLNEWCAANGESRSYLRAALLGLTDSPRAQKARAKVMRAARITDAA